ncbi:MFS transporter [Agromyces protaetiae]|uniref:MFS transporter n=1 Tax=Agromyces protaetiae TaxID=2509455 RepID=A0A4P6FE80_9MICO|nr:MFS transporter [Agromyces protaetiae]QAY74096.1 MFS transporter [Agromyces protaetiae]
MSDSTTAEPPARTPYPTWTAPPGVTPRRAWAAFAVLLIGAFMSLLDTTIVNVALPTIRDAIDADEATLAWIISGYALAFGLALIPAGRLGDRFGHKWVFFTGLAIFTAASLWCGLAQGPVELIIARVVQGLGGGIFFPAVTAFGQLLFAPQKRGAAFGVMGAVIGVSTALGPIVGGLLIEALGDETGWRWIFAVNIPIGVVALVLAATVIPAVKAGQKAATDLVGLLLLAAGLTALLVPLIQGQDEGWPLWTFLSLAGGVVLLVAFWFWESALARRGVVPLVPPRLFAHPQFTGGTVLALVYFAAFTSIFFVIALLWQAGLGHTALESGLVTIPFAIGNIVGAATSDRLAQRLGRGVLLLGTALVAVGLAAVWLVLELVPAADLNNWLLLAPLLVAGIGNGFFIAPNARFIVATVDGKDAGAASGVIGTVQRIGSAIGIAVVSSVLFAVADLGSVGDDIQAAMQSGDFSSPDAAAASVLADHFVPAATTALALSVAFAVISFALVWTLPKRVSLHGAPD